MPETTTTVIDDRALTEGHRGRLASVVEHLDRADDELGEVARVLGGCISREDGWLLSGFCEDAILELGEVARAVIGIRVKVDGGLSGADERILAAFGRSNDA